MTEHTEREVISPGMAAFSLEGQEVGTVEMANGDDLRIAGRAVQVNDVVRIDQRGVHLRLPASDFAAGATSSHANARVNTADNRQTLAPSGTDDREGRIVIPLAEERLKVDTREISLGEVIIRKRVIEEEQMVPVMVRREVVEVLRLAPGEPVPDDWKNDPTTEVARLPLTGTEPAITTEAFVTREVIVDRAARAEEWQVTDTVRREQIETDADYTRARPNFERHFAEGTDASGTGAGDFAAAEPHYRAGYTAGRDPRYTDQDFATAEPQLRREYETGAQASDDPWERLRERIRTGYEAARR